MKLASLLLAACSVMPLASVSAQNPPAEVAKKIEAALPDRAFAPPEKPRKLLLFSATNGFRHESIPTGLFALAELGKKSGAYEAVVSNDISNFEVDQLKRFDAICFLSTTQDVFMPHPNLRKSMTPEQLKDAEARAERLKKNFLAYLRSGHGFVGIHAATDTCLEWADYGEMIGGCFDGHPWDAKAKVSIKVEPGKEKHPLVAMFKGENLALKEEIYQFKAPYDSRNVDMLLRLDPDKTPMDVKGIKRKDKDFGVSWAKHYGKGRVFYCSLGHNHDIYWQPLVLTHYLAGIQWALGDFKVDVQP
jgi:type 1 glutamine amidotransferase